MTESKSELVSATKVTGAEKHADRIDEETERLITAHAEDWQIYGEWVPRSDFEDYKASTADEYRAIAEKSSAQLLKHVRQVTAVANLAIEIIQDCRKTLNIPKGVSLTETIAALKSVGS
jgi:hypothetical protein